MLSLRSSCERDASETACSDDADVHSWSELQIELDAEETVFLMVDGYDSYEAGEYRLTITSGECEP